LALYSTDTYSITAHRDQGLTHSSGTPQLLTHAVIEHRLEGPKKKVKTKSVVASVVLPTQ